MTEEEKKEIREYFKLCTYRDGEYFLPEEYEELVELIKKNTIVRLLEEARYKWIMQKMSNEDYMNLCDYYEKESTLELRKE